MSKSNFPKVVKTEFFEYQILPKFAEKSMIQIQIISNSPIGPPNTEVFKVFSVSDWKKWPPLIVSLILFVNVNYK